MSAPNPMATSGSGLKAMEGRMSISSKAALVVAVANGPLSDQRVKVPNGVKTARPMVVLVGGADSEIL